MYDYRKMTPQERRETLAARQERGFPPHTPPHIACGEGDYLITAACFEHRSVFDGPAALSWLASEVLNTFSSAGQQCFAWAFLPNHYHVLVRATDLSVVSEVMRLKHSAITSILNRRDGRLGRRVWYRFADRSMRSERHFWATVNYIHANPTKHGYVDAPSDWPWSSLGEYIGTHGSQWVEQIQSAYPVLAYGKSWD